MLQVKIFVEKLVAVATAVEKRIYSIAERKKIGRESRLSLRKAHRIRGAHKHIHKLTLSPKYIAFLATAMGKNIKKQKLCVYRLRKMRFSWTLMEF